MAQINVLFIHGAGPNAFFGGALERLRNNTVAKFGNKIWCPYAVDYTETAKIAEFIDRWRDPAILVNLSCGCSAGNAIANARPNEVILYAMHCSPSAWCGLGNVPKNVARATQVTSNAFDFFNIGARRLVKPTPGNTTTVIDEISTGYPHVSSPAHPSVQKRLFEEIERGISM